MGNGFKGLTPVPPTGKRSAGSGGDLSELFGQVAENGVSLIGVCKKLKQCLGNERRPDGNWLRCHPYLHSRPRPSDILISA